MHEQPTRPRRPAEARPIGGVYVGSETLPEGPHIYVVNEALLARGVDRGRWLHAATPVDSLAKEIRKLLPALRPGKPLVGWAIHGYSGFGDWQLNKYEELEKVSRVAREITDKGAAFGSWVELVKPEPELEGQFKDFYLGSWGSLEDFVDDFAADLGMTLDDLNVEPRWRPFIRLDRQALLDEILRPGEIVIREQNDRVSVFLSPHLERPAERALDAMSPIIDSPGMKLVVDSTVPFVEPEA